MALAMIFPNLRKKTGTTFRKQVASIDPETKQVNFTLETPIAVQVTLNENYDFNAEISDNPVERGIDVTDNINIRPLEISLTMKQSDTPIDIENVLRGAALTGSGLLGNTIGGGVGQVGTAGLAGLLMDQANQSLARTCYNHFRTLFESKALLTIQTGLDLFENMAIQSIQFTRGPSTGRSIDFTVRLRQIRFVSALVLDVPIKSRNVSDQASKKSDLGRQESKEVTSPQRSASLALSFARLFGG
jgi:hypothetical protein